MRLEKCGWKTPNRSAAAATNVSELHERMGRKGARSQLKG
jgi:hypothetical protein